MRPIKYPVLQIHLLLILLLAINSSPVQSQTTSMDANLSSPELVSGDQFTVSISTDGDSDLYFFSAEIEYDTDQLELMDVQAAGAMAGGLIISNEIAPGVYGAAVSRTEALEEDVSADMMLISFQVKEFPLAGEGEISLSNINFSDSEGASIDFTAPENAEYMVLKSIVDFSLTIPANIDVTEGDSYLATGEIYATGITIDDDFTDSLQVWVGVHETNTDPSTWDETAWELMTFTEQIENDYFAYSGDIAFQRPVGTYFVALRSEISGSGDYEYGGIGGFWDESTNPSSEMEIMEQPPFRYVIAEWTFEYEQMTPTRALPVNQLSELELFGASLNGFTSDAANSNGWDSFEEGANYWQIQISTENLEELRLSSKQYSSGTGPGQFLLEWGTDGEIWNTFGDTITVETNLTSGVLNEVSLPAGAENQPELYIRWVQASDLRSDGDTELTISSGGTSRIDDILITGINTVSNRLNVWPGDANQDGVVDEEDISPLGIYWLVEGPAAIYPTIQFEEREVEQWVPSEATYADANGDGRVDQNDLQPIGLHFGKEVAAGLSAKRHSAPVALLQIEPLDVGETADLYIISDDPVDLSGLTFRIDFEDLDGRAWSISDVDPLVWGGEWQDQNRMIRFQTRKDEMFAAAMVHKGVVESKTAKNLVRIRIRAEQSWQEPETVRLLRASITTGRSTTNLTNLELSSELAVSLEPPVTERPMKTELLPNYPNPFNPATTIPYTLSEPGAAEIEIFDAIGRKVARIQYDIRPAGTYTYRFDASALSSGIYLYRLRANNVVQTRKMILLK